MIPQTLRSYLSDSKVGLIWDASQKGNFLWSGAKKRLGSVGIPLQGHLK